MTQQSAVSLRRVHEVQEWIDAENFPKALQACEKWFKKGERSSTFLTRRALVLTLQKDGYSRRLGQEEAVKLCQHDPPLTGLDELLDLEKSFESLDVGQEHAQKAWDRAAKADPKNSDLQETRVRNCIDQEDWKGAQQAAMTLRKNFPALRKYEFWAIFLSYLVSKILESPPGLFGQLAYKMIKSLGEKTPIVIPEDDLRSGKYIIYADELILLLDIYHFLGKFQEGIEVLDSQNLGIRTGIGKQEPSTFSMKRIEMLRKLERWNEVAEEYLETFRRLDRMGNDGERCPEVPEAMNVTASLAEAIRKAEDRRVFENAQNFFTEALKKTPDNVAFRYAQLELTVIEVERGTQTSEVLLAMLKSFFTKFWMHWRLAELTIETTKCLGRELAKDLVNFICQEVEGHKADTKNWIWTGRVKNALEAEYRLVISESTDPEMFLTFALKCIKIHGDTYRLSSVDEYARCIAAIPAVVSLLRLREPPAENRISWRVRGSNLHQACLILFHALEHLPSCEEPCVLLIPFASTLGLIPLALRAYKRLSIKNMQIDNFAHNMFSRISTLHPYDIDEHPSEREFRPYDYLLSAIAQYKIDDKTFARQIMSGMASGIYPNTESAIHTRHNKAFSICKRLYLLEKRRIERFMGRESGYSKLVAENGKALEIRDVIDTRSGEGFPNLESPNRPPFLEQLRYAPYPQDEWVSVMTAQDQALHRLHAISQYDPSKSRYLEYSNFQEEIELMDKWLDFAVDADLQLTEVEDSNFQLVITYVKAAFFLKLSDIEDSPTIQSHNSHFQSLIDIIERWLKKQNANFSDLKKIGLSETVTSIKGRDIPASWLYFHRSYATLEALQGLALFLKVVKPYHKPKREHEIFVPSERQEQMREMVLGLEKKIHDHAKHLRGELERQGFLDDMIDMILEREENGRQGRIGQELEKVVDESTMESTLGMVKDAWASGLEGIGKVKVVVS